MPKNQPSNLPSDRRKGILRDIILDPHTKPQEREAALVEYDKLLGETPAVQPSTEPSSQPAPTPPARDLGAAVRRDLAESVMDDSDIAAGREPMRREPRSEDFLPKPEEMAKYGPPKPVDPVAQRQREEREAGRNRPLQEGPLYFEDKVVVTPGIPAKYAPAGHSQESFRAALKDAERYMVAASYQAPYWTHLSTSWTNDSRSHRQDLLDAIQREHPAWDATSELLEWEKVFKADPMLYAQAMRDIAGAWLDFDRQHQLEADLKARLAAETREDVNAILVDAIRRTRPYQPLGEEERHFSSKKRVPLVADIPGRLISPEVPAVKRTIRTPVPRVDRPVRTSDPDNPNGLPFPEGSARIVDPDDVPAAPSVTPSYTPPPEKVFQELQDDNGRRIALLDPTDRRLITGVVRRAEEAILRCTDHNYSDGRCSCWTSEYLNVLHDYGRRQPDGPVHASLSYFYDRLIQASLNRPRQKSHVEEALNALGQRLDIIAERQELALESSAWIGRRKPKGKGDLLKKK